MKLSKLRQNSALESEGVWVDYMDGSRLKIARIGTRSYEKAVRELSEEHTNELRNTGTLNEEIQEKITRKSVARAVLLDWEGFYEDEELDKAPDLPGNFVEVREGVWMESIPYTSELGEELFTEGDDFRDLYLFIIGVASTKAAYQKKKDDAESGN